MTVIDPAEAGETQPARPPATIGPAVEQFLRHSGLEPRTQKTYSSGIRSWLASLEDSSGGAGADLPIATLHDGVLEDFQQYLLERGYSRFTVRTYLASLSGLIQFLLVRDLLPPSFSLEKAKARLRQGRRGTPYPAPVPDPALPLIIRYYDEQPLPQGDGTAETRARLRVLRSRAIVHTLYSSAGRIAEVWSLDRRDVADGRLSEAVVLGKGRKQRFIYLTRLARGAIGAYTTERQDTFQPLFISHGRSYGSRLSKVTIWQTVKDAAKALHLDVSPHDFRHFRARQMLDEGAPLEAIQEILGHSDISTTRKVYAIYSHHSVREIFSRSTLTPEEALAVVDPESLRSDSDRSAGEDTPDQ